MLHPAFFLKNESAKPKHPVDILPQQVGVQLQPGCRPANGKLRSKPTRSAAERCADRGWTLEFPLLSQVTRTVRTVTRCLRKRGEFCEHVHYPFISCSHVLFTWPPGYASTHPQPRTPAGESVRARCVNLELRSRRINFNKRSTRITSERGDVPSTPADSAMDMMDHDGSMDFCSDVLWLQVC